MTEIIKHQKSARATCKKKRDYITGATIFSDEICIVKIRSSWGFLGRQIDGSELDAFVDRHLNTHGNLSIPMEMEGWLSQSRWC